MAGVSNLRVCGYEQKVLFRERKGLGLFQDGTRPSDRLILSRPERIFPTVTQHTFCTRATLVDERPTRGRNVAPPAGVLAYDLVQGALVRWSSVVDRSIPDPPTAVLLHGILGGRKNWGSFARRLAKEFPTWQFLLVDLRCHGDSAAIKKSGPHTVASAALDVLKLFHYGCSCQSVRKDDNDDDDDLGGGGDYNVPFEGRRHSTSSYGYY